MRNYQFRGERIDNGEWAYGDLINYVNGKTAIRNTESWLTHWVDPATVGQYTGLKDKSGAEVYEGDILRFDDTGEEGYEYKEGFDFQNVARVEFQDGRFQLTDFASENSGVLHEMHNFHIDFVANFKYSEVIGNIHDNPELLEGDE